MVVVGRIETGKRKRYQDGNDGKAIIGILIYSTK
jgi:hypothetical protein